MAQASKEIRDKMVEAQRDLADLYARHDFNYALYGIRETDKPDDTSDLEIVGTAHLSFYELAVIVLKACKNDTELFLQSLFRAKQDLKTEKIVENSEEYSVTSAEEETK